MDENELEITIDEDLQSSLEQIQDNVQPGSATPTDVDTQPEQVQQPSTE